MKGDAVVMPNFFIAGAPKSGTTALNKWLSEHSDIFMARKESHYWATDLRYRVSTFAEYQRLFADCPPDIRHIGEASVWYMYSDVALQGIREALPEAQIIVSLRDPVQLILSNHARMILNGDEDVHDFEQAWRLERSRRRGENLPPHVSNPRYLYYSDVGSVGKYTSRLLEIFPAEQVLVLIMDDLFADPAKFYDSVLSFLRVPSDMRRDFSVVNPRQVPRSDFIARLLNRPPSLLKRAIHGTEHVLGLEQVPGLTLIRRMNTRIEERPALNPAFEEELRGYFAGDVALLESILDRNLASWKKPQTNRPL